MSIAPTPLAANRNLINTNDNRQQQHAASPHKAAAPRKSVAAASITASPPVAQHITQRRAGTRRTAVREPLTPVAPPSPAAVDDAPVLADLRLLAPITLASEGGAEGIHLALRVGGGGDGSDLHARSAALATKLMVDLSRSFSRVYSSWDECAMLSHVVSPLIDALFMDTGRGATIVCQGGVAPAAEEATTMWGDAFAPKLTALQAAEQGDKENPASAAAAATSCGPLRRGLVKHCLELLFAHISAANSSELSAFSWALGVSAVDITPADQLVDCFAPHAATQPKLLESWSGDLTMAHTTRKLVHSASHGLRLVATMLSNNAKDPQTAWNHRLLTFTLERKSKAEGTVAATTLQLFDLAQAQPEPVATEPAAPSSSSSAASSSLPPIPPLVRRLVNPSLIALDKVVVRLAQLNRQNPSQSSAHSSGRRASGSEQQSPASSRSPSPSVSPSPTQSPSHQPLKSAPHIAWREGLLTRLLKASLGNAQCRSHCAWILGFDAQESGSIDLVSRMKFAQKLSKISNVMTSPAEDAANAAAAAAAAALEGHHQPSTNLSGHMSLHDETLQEILFRQAQINDPLAAVAAGPATSSQGSRGGTPRQSGVHARLSATPSRRASVVAELNVVGTGIKARRKLFEASDNTAADLHASPISARKTNRVSFRDHDDATAAIIPPPQSSPISTKAPGAAPVSSTRRWKFTASKTASASASTRATAHANEEPELPTDLARALGIKPVPAAKIAPLTSPVVPAAYSAAAASSPAPWPPAGLASISRRRWVVKPNASATVGEQKKAESALINLQAAHASLEQQLAAALATVQALTQKAQESERQLLQFRQASPSADTSALSNTCESLRSELACVESQLDSLCGSGAGDRDEPEIGMHSLDSLEDMDENFIRSSLDTPRNGYGHDEHTYTEAEEEEWRDASSVIPLSLTMDRPRRRSPNSAASSAAKGHQDGESAAARIRSKALKMLSKAGMDARRISINDSLSSADTSATSAGNEAEAAAGVEDSMIVGTLSPGPISPAPTCSSSCVSRRASLFCAESPVATRLNALIRSSMSIHSFALHCSAARSGAHSGAQASPAMSPQQLRTWKVAKRAPAPNLVLPSVAARAAAAAAANNSQAAPAASPEKQQPAAIAPRTPVAADPLEAEAQRLAASGLRIRTNRKLQQQAEEASQTAAGCSIQ